MQFFIQPLYDGRHIICTKGRGDAFIQRPGSFVPAIEPDDIGQDDGVGQAVGDMEQAAHRMGHAVYNPQRDVRKRHTGDHGGVEHRLAGGDVLPVVKGFGQGVEDICDRAPGKRVRNIIGPGGTDCLPPPSPERMPILQDLYEELLCQPKLEARRVASALELYCTRSLNLFNHRTNVEVSNRLLCYDIKSLGKMLKRIGLLILADQIWGRVTASRDRHKSTWVYQDEFHVLLPDPQVEAYCVEIFRRFRKWGSIPSGITQNVKSLLESSKIESIFGNCDFLYMLSQAAGEREVLASHLGISPYQLPYVTHFGFGEGLLFYGVTTIPFADRFPRDIELYALLTTKPEDKANERKDE